MSHYFKGDVILAPIRIGRGRDQKVRPGVVLGASGNGKLIVCPISARPPFDASYIPVALADFESGGLEIVGESYLLVEARCTIDAVAVVGKKGALRSEFLEKLFSLY